MLTSLLVIAQEPDLEWVKSIGSNGRCTSFSINYDNSGNIYITGGFENSVDFDPSNSTYYLQSNGLTDAYVAKFDSSGNFIWAKSFGGTDFDQGRSIVIDSLNNIYITGSYTGVVDFDPDSSIFNLTSSFNSDDLFVQKLDSNGHFIWAKSFGQSSDDWGNSITIGNLGGIFITGTVSNNVIIIKLDSLGSTIWAKYVGGVSGDEGYSIATDLFENVFVTGFFRGVADFDPGSLIFNLTAQGPQDIFILKLNTNGSFDWAKQIGGNLADWGFSIAIDLNGNIYTTGIFRGAGDFDPGSSIYTLTSAGLNDIFIEKLDANGNFIWAKRIGGSGFDEGYSISIDRFNNLYITGAFWNTVDFDPNVGNYNLTSQGYYDVFIEKLDANGNFIWAQAMGGTTFSRGYGIITDQKDNIYVTGFFDGVVDFDPDSGIFNLTSSGDKDIFVQKLNPCYKYGVDTINTCEPYTWIDSITYTSNNNTAIYSLTNLDGCDSIITLNLTIVPYSRTDTISACDSYKWINGVIYTSSNTNEKHTIIDSTGCDSILFLNLTINKSTQSRYEHTACNSFMWIDSVNYYESNNNIPYTLTNKDGCDSVISLDLTIHHTILEFNLGEDTTMCFGKDLLLNAPNTNAQYLWQDNTDSSSFLIEHPGVYWVELSNICGKMSDTVIIYYEECDCDIFIPNSFTPNNDNNNDTFSPLFYCDFEYYNFQIFDRWGKKLFETNNKNHSWDGTHAGIKAANAVYAYVLTYSLVHQRTKTITGTVLISR